MAISKERIKQEIETADKTLAELEPAVEINKLVRDMFKELLKK